MFKRTINTEEVRKLYMSIDDKSLSEEDKYRFLTKNDPDIVKFKKKVLKISQDRGLGAFMNTTKWLRLQKAMNQLDYVPGYFEKLITDSVFSYKNIGKNTTSFSGDWSPYYMEGMPLFFNIEYLIIIPRYREYLGKLVPDKIIDYSLIVESVLQENTIPYEIDNNNFIVYGYK